jgi:rare lipoprotein A
LIFGDDFMQSRFSNNCRRLPVWTLGLAVLIIGITGCASPRRTPGAPSRSPEGASMSVTVGVASYYGAAYQGKPTASGEIYDMNRLTAAHRTLPFGLNVRVTNLSNNRCVVVRINDRGPFVRERIIDLSLAAARELGFVAAGSATVRVEVLGATVSRR